MKNSLILDYIFRIFPVSSFPFQLTDNFDYFKCVFDY